MRPSWNGVWITVARTVAERSLCSRAQVGAVIVSADNRVQSASYNGPVPGFDHDKQPCTAWCPRAKKEPGDALSPEYLDCAATHAEASALVRADRSQLEGASIYVSGAVCINCAKLICHTGIKTVFHVVHATDAHRDPEVVEKFLRENGRAVIRMT